MRKLFAWLLVSSFFVGTAVYPFKGDLDFIAEAPFHGGRKGGVRYDFGNGNQLEVKVGWLDSTGSGSTKFLYDVSAWYENFGLGVFNSVSGATNQDDLGGALLFRVEQPINDVIALGIKTQVVSLYPAPYQRIQILNEWSAYISLNFISAL